MTEVIYHTLRAANVARDMEWTAGASIADHTWRAAELAGEVGEVVELLLDPNVALFGNFALEEELADVVICIDLTRMTMGILEPIDIFSTGSIDSRATFWRHTFAARGLARPTLLLCNTLKKVERERRGWPGSRAGTGEVDHFTRLLMGRIGLLADYAHITLEAAVSNKFNRTSEKVGLATRLYYRPGTAIAD